MPYSRLVESPVPLTPSSQARERAAFDCTVTVLDGSGGDAYGVFEEHRSIPCNVSPLSNRDLVGRYETSRDYTDTIKLEGFYPRLRSGLVAHLTRPNGEQADYYVVDIATDGDSKHTTLLTKRMFDTN